MLTCFLIRRHRRENLPEQFEVREIDRSRNEQLYVPVDSYGRIRQTGTRPPMHDSTSAPVYHRGLPPRGEVIVLE